MMKRVSSARSALIEGARAGLILATVECAIRSVLSPFTSRFLTPENPSVILVPYLVYPIGTLLVTLLVVITVRSDPAKIATAVVSLAIGLSTLVVAGPATSLGIVALSVVLTVLTFRPLFGRRLQSLMPPVTAFGVSALLIGALWLIREVLYDFSRRQKLLVVPMLIPALILALLACRKWIPRVRLGAAALAATAVGVALAALLLNRGVNFGEAGDSARRRPNIILVTLDTVRADHTTIGGYARDTTPELAKFAAVATKFTNAISSSNYTLPSHTSLFTGLPPTVHGNYEPANGGTLSPADTTLAAILQEHGYDTYSVAANSPYLGTAFGLGRGFQYLDNRIEDDVHYSPRDALAECWRTTLPGHAREAEGIAAEASAVIRKASRRDRPFFLFVNFMDCHHPYSAPHSYLARFGGIENGPKIEPLVEGYLRDMVVGRLVIPPRIRQYLIDHYDAALAFADHHAACLLDTARESGAYDGSLIAITSDHGEAFGDKGFYGHGGYSLYQDAIHIPMVLKFPHQTSGVIRTEPVALLDLYATALEAARTRSPHEDFGTSLREPPRASRVVFSEGFTVTSTTTRILRAAVLDRYKMIRDGAAVSIFDIRSDPNELRDLTPEAAPAIVRSLDAEIEALARLQPHNVEGRPVDPETEKRLRALGYVH